jgi:hypothetical protein
MTGIKCITKLEFDLITSGSVDYFDTFFPNEYVIGSFVDLRCYFHSIVSSSAENLTVLIVNKFIVSRNTVSAKSLYRVVFQLT